MMSAGKKNILAGVLCAASVVAAAIDYRVIDRASLEPYLADINVQRVDFYREYPYLFISEVGAQNEDVSVFLNSQETLMVGAFDNDQLIGFMLGVPLKEYNTTTCGAIEKEMVYAQDTFKNIEFSLDTCFYISEMCVMPGDYDRDEIADTLFKKFQHALQAQSTNYTHLCMIVIELPEDHPMRPHNPSERWAETEGTHLHNNGFVHTDWSIVYEWPTLQVDGSVRMQKNPMNFWYKNIQS